ncbi:Heterogeneous nuclear ribonucleoprotein K [Trichoplax sp. H2]|nr:Heterogeneous nuclear ribonucleoprotein K [Trichoplax sp. H2]|eukprot:RDD37459.1 Heterogeneous nuclear ribonucleoprotein K [Trichoplax sp. H2]
MADVGPGGGMERDDGDDGGRGEQLKRSADIDNYDEAKNKRAKTDDSDVEISARVLIQSRDAGGIIGKGGLTIKRLRSEYNAVVSVPESHSTERILTIKAGLKNVLSIFHEVIPKLGDYRDRPADSDNYQTEVNLLVQQSQVGGIIGRAGFKIKELRQETNAGIKIFADTMPRSTERVVSITGTPATIVKAIQSILEILLESPPKGRVDLYDPDNNLSRGGSNYRDNRYRDNQMPPASSSRGSDWRSEGDYDRPYDYPRGRGRDYDRDSRSGPARRGRPQSNWDSDPRYPNYRREPSSRYPPISGSPEHGRRYPRDDRGYERDYEPRDRPFYGRDFQDSPHQPPMDYGHEPVSHQPKEPAERPVYGGDSRRQEKGPATVQVSIPKDLAGSIIGKGGTRIRDVRERSGAMIKIDDARPGEDYRVITISGGKDQIDEAHGLLQDW